MTDTTDRMMYRQWQIIIYLLQQTHYICASQIQDHLKTQGIHAEMRTVQRDLKALQKVLPLECRTDDKPYGWRWKRLDNVKSHGMNIKQAILLKLIEAELSDLIPADVMEQLRPILIKSNVVLANAAMPSDRPLGKSRGGSGGVSGVVPISPVNKAWFEIHALFEDSGIAAYFKGSPNKLDKKDKIALKQLLVVLEDLNLSSVVTEMKKVAKV